MEIKRFSARMPEPLNEILAVVSSTTGISVNRVLFACLKAHLPAWIKKHGPLKTYESMFGNWQDEMKLKIEEAIAKSEEWYDK